MTILSKFGPNDDDDIGNRRVNVNDNGRPVDEPTTSDSHDYTEEPHMSYGSQGRESLNNLSPISDQEKHKNVSLTLLPMSSSSFGLINDRLCKNLNRVGRIIDAVCKMLMQVLK
jgi:hypothetical protein